MKIIVGLGNIGKEYEHTVHNMGFDCVDRVAEKLGVQFTKNKFKAKIAEASINGEKIVLVKPETYMNLSGISVKDFVKNSPIDISKDLLIISDDVDLPAGTIRFRVQGSAGSHNGLKSIVEHLKTTAFFRLRIGVGRAPEYMKMEDYVLSSIKNNKEVNDGNIRASEAVIDFINGLNAQELMQKYN